MGIETEMYAENGRTKELCRTDRKKAPSRGGVTTVKNKRGETTKDKVVRLERWVNTLRSSSQGGPDEPIRRK